MQISLFAILLSATEALPSPFELDALLDRFLAPSDLFGTNGVVELKAEPLGDGEALALLDSMNPFLSSFSGFMNRLKLLDPFALLPDRFELPNVTISDAECLVTINLNGMDVNSTSIRVYSSDTDLSVEITNTQSMTASPDNTEEGVTEEEFELSNIERLFNLRGSSSMMSSFTTVRSFPAPKGCDLTSEASKATIDEKEGNLLVKFPKVGETLAPVEEQAIVRSALAVEDAPVGGGWLRNLFGSKGMMKVPVPLVRYDEF